MKDYKQFIKQLPSSTIVCALGDFDPPTTAHELLIQTVKVVAEQRNCDHVVFLSTSETLQEDRKKHYLKLMFPNNNFVALGESFFSTVVKKLNEKYKNVVVIAGADQFDEFKNLKESSIEVISIGTKDPDADNPKMIQTATKGIYEEFKKLLPSTVRDIDGKRLMNEMRIGLGLEPVKEQINLVKDKLREKYFRGEVFNIGELVESDGQQYEIIKRGSNHLLLKDQNGELVSKWISDVKEVKEGVIQPNGTDKIDTNSPQAAGNNQIQKPKGKVKGFLTFYNYDDKTKNINEVSSKLLDRYKEKANKSADDLASQGKHKQSADRRMNVMKATGKQIEKTTYNIGQALKYGSSAKLKEQIEQTEDLEHEEVNEGLGRFIAKGINALHKANQKTPLPKPEDRRKFETPKTQDRPGSSTEYNKPTNPFFKEEFDLTEDEIDALVESVPEEELLGLDEHTEWDLVYEDNEEVIPPHPDEEQIELMEVLSRQERLKGKIRLRRTAAKRSRSTKINVHRYADPKTLNKRARRLAIKLIKQRMLRGRNPAKVSVSDKERIEKQLSKNKNLVNRVAQKLVVRVRRVEKSRMSKGKSKKGTMPSVF